MRCAGPKHVVKRGKTPVLTEEQAAPRCSTASTRSTARRPARPRADRRHDLRLRAHRRRRRACASRTIIPNGKRWWVRLHEKGGKRHEMPAHHKLEAYLDEYLAAAGIRDDGKAPSSAPPSAEPAC